MDLRVAASTVQILQESAPEQFQFCCTIVRVDSGTVLECIGVLLCSHWYFELIGCCESDALRYSSRGSRVCFKGKRGAYWLSQLAPRSGLGRLPLFVAVLFTCTIAVRSSNVLFLSSIRHLFSSHDTFCPSGVGIRPRFLFILCCSQHSKIRVLRCVCGGRARLLAIFPLNVPRRTLLLTCVRRRSQEKGPSSGRCDISELMSVMFFVTEIHFLE